MISRIGSWLRRRVQQWLYRWGYEVVPVRDSFVAQQGLVAGKKELVIFDVGAHTGESARQYARYFPTARIHSFEPIPENFEQLLILQSELPQLKPHRLAADAAVGEREFRVRHWDYSSSFYENGEETARYHPGSMMQTTERLQVATTRLDHFCQGHDISFVDILKLDIQGAELAALQGAERLLRTEAIGLIYCEVEFVELYRDQPLFHDITAYLQEFNYRLWNLYNLVHHHDELVYADAIFIPSRRTKNLK